VAPESREGWYDRQIRGGIQAVICHPKLVQTGLDLIDFPTILFYETGYSIYVLRQASRRSWRIGQRLPVNVKFLHYAETMQESCLRLMGKKLLVSLAMEGQFSSEGLQAINEEDDILMAMARELVTEKGIGERADSVWNALQKQQEEVFAARSSEVEGLASEPEHETEVVTTEAINKPASPLVPPTAPLAIRPKTSRRGGVLEGQLTLF
jgi:hypothetical protein